jgi:hypothetical protein
MTEERMALAELLQKSSDGDFLRSVAEAVLQILMEADVEGMIGAGRHERTGDRLKPAQGERQLLVVGGGVAPLPFIPEPAGGSIEKRPHLGAQLPAIRVKARRSPSPAGHNR